MLGEHELGHLEVEQACLNVKNVWKILKDMIIMTTWLEERQHELVEVMPWQGHVIFLDGAFLERRFELYEKQGNSVISMKTQNTLKVCYGSPQS